MSVRCLREEKMSGGGWSCPHEVNGLCSKVRSITCEPGMKGCTLSSRYAFYDAEKNQRLLQLQARQRTAGQSKSLSPSGDSDADPETGAGDA